jgi:hypothetical protein
MENNHGFYAQGYEEFRKGFELHNQLERRGRV